MYRMKSLTYGTTTALEQVITTGTTQQDRVPKADLREIAQSQNKPSPKLQPMPANTQNMRIHQPM